MPASARPPVCESCRRPMRPAMRGGLGQCGAEALELWVCRPCGRDTLLLLDADGNDMGGERFARRHLTIEPTDAPTVADSEAD